MKDIGRFINFSDAVIAIAVTLLVLPLAEHAADLHVNSYHAFTSAFGRQLLIFLLSFVIVCRYWEIHHNLLGSLRTFNTKLFWLNTFWLISIVLIPFTIEVIVNSQGSSTFAIGVYIGNLLATSYLGLGMEWLVAHSPELHKTAVEEKAYAGRGVITALAMTLALILSLFIRGLGPWSLLLLVPAGFMERWVYKRL